MLTIDAVPARETNAAPALASTGSGTSRARVRAKRAEVCDEIVERGVGQPVRRETGHQRLRDSRPTHNRVIREHLTNRLTAGELKALGALWVTILGDLPGPAPGAG